MVSHKSINCLVVRAKRMFEGWSAKLTPEQRKAVADVAVFGYIPQFTERLKLRPLPADEQDRLALTTGLAALAGDQPLTEAPRHKKTADPKAGRWYCYSLRV
jgi:hypothetical protein